MRPGCVDEVCGVRHLLQDLTGTLEHARAVLGSGVSLEGDVWGADADEDEENEETGYERK
jgi:hypothetical protein